MGIKDLRGQRFGWLTVVEFAGTKNSNAYWKCRCDCRNVCTVNGVHLRRGYTQSCGCLRRENSGCTPKHGLSSSKIYGVWQRMRHRCFNKNDKNFSQYGGRGIKVCDEWRNDFQAFYDCVSKLEHFGEEGYSFDRINNDGNYEPSNVRWATMKEQNRNRRSNVVVEYKGKKVSLKEAAELSGIKYLTLFQRYHRGWRDAQLFNPVEP